MTTEKMSWQLKKLYKKQQTLQSLLSKTNTVKKWALLVTAGYVLIIGAFLWMFTDLITKANAGNLTMKASDYTPILWGAFIVGIVIDYIFFRKYKGYPAVIRHMQKIAAVFMGIAKKIPNLFGIRWFAMLIAWMMGCLVGCIISYLFPITAMKDWEQIQREQLYAVESKIESLT